MALGFTALIAIFGNDQFKKWRYRNGHDRRQSGGADRRGQLVVCPLSAGVPPEMRKFYEEVISELKQVTKAMERAGRVSTMNFRVLRGVARHMGLDPNGILPEDLDNI